MITKALYFHDPLLLPQTARAATEVAFATIYSREQSKQEKYDAMLKSGVPPQCFGITKPSKVVKLPHELEEGYKEYHDRPLYMRLFRNYEEQHEENKKWDELSRLPELHFHSRMLSNDNSKKQKDRDNGPISIFDPSQESVQVFIGKPGFEDIALLINAEYNIKKDWQRNMVALK